MNSHSIALQGQMMSPESLKSCIWMTAGVISYKLCPLNFNCDECEFDAAMRRQKRVAMGLGDNRPPSPPQP